MKNVIENLERYYQSFINQKEDWNFFYLLADYIEYVLKTPETKEILDLLIEESHVNEMAKNEYEEEDIKLWKVWNKLVSVYITIFRFDELVEKLSKARRNDKTADKALFELFCSAFKMEEIKNGQKTPRPKNEENFQFYRNNYEIYATRIHNYLIQELSKKAGGELLWICLIKS